MEHIFNLFVPQALRSIHSSRRWAILPALLLLALIGWQCGLPEARAQADPPESNCTGTIRTDRSKYMESALPTLPLAGGRVCDNTFGTLILRATDQMDDGPPVSGVPFPGLGTYYSHWSTFNSNNTYLLIRKGDTGDALIKHFDAAAFTVTDRGHQPGAIVYNGVNYGTADFEGAIWDTTDPNILYCFPIKPVGGLRLFTYNVSTRQYDLVHDFSSLAVSSSDVLRQMSMATKGAHAEDVFAWTHAQCDSTCNNPTSYAYLVWRRSDNKIYHVVKDSANDFNEVRLDKTGGWLHIPLNDSVEGHVGANFLNIETGDITPVKNSREEKSPGHGDLGTGTIIGFDVYDDGITWRRLATTGSDALTSPVDRFHFETTDAMFDWSEDFHASMLADDENWATVGTFDSTRTPDFGIFENEIFQIALDGSHRVRRICHTRSTNDYYGSYPKPNISRDGKFIAFTSNWEGSGRTDLFIVRVDPAAPPLSARERINAGGPRVYPANDWFWQRDAEPKYAATGNGITSSILTAGDIITDPAFPTDPQIYLSERYGGAPANAPTIPAVSYAIPVQNGTYTVRLHFAEIYWCVGTNPCPNYGSGPGVGARVFDAKLEGTTVLTNYDIIARTGGPKRAKVEQFQTTVNDGVLNVNLVVKNSTDHAKISAIEVLPSSSCSGGPYDVTWTSPAGVSVNCNNLTKIGATGWNAGAISAQTLSSGDGFAEFSTSEADKGKIIGLSYQTGTSLNEGASYQEIEFALHLRNDHYVLVFEKGTNMGVWETYAAGDKFRVAVENGAVKYQKSTDGGLTFSTFYTNAAPTLQYPMAVDCSLYNTGASITSARLVPTVSDVWAQGVGVTISGDMLTKISATGWNAGAISVKTLSTGNGYVQFSTNEADKGKIIGLSYQTGTSLNEGQSYQEIEYALHLRNDGNVLVFESGMNLGVKETYVAGNKFRVTIENGAVKYQKSMDGVTFTTFWTNSTPTLQYPMVVDTSLYNTGATVKDIVLSGAWN